MKKRFFLLITAILLTFTNPIEVNAQIKTFPDGTQFDAEYYATAYPDVVAALGTGEAELYNHFVLFGKDEGRLPYSNAGVEETADVAVYNRIMSFRTVYPEGMTWNENNTYTSIHKGRGCDIECCACQAFAYMLQDQVFPDPGMIIQNKTILFDWVMDNATLVDRGSYYTYRWECVSRNGCWVPIVNGIEYDGSNPEMNEDFERIYEMIKVGDLVSDSNHISMVLSKDETGITVVEGNFNGRVHWDRTIKKDALRKALFTVEHYIPY